MSKLLKKIMCGIAVVFIILVVMVIIKKYSQENYSNISQINLRSNSDDNCLTGCSEPSALNKNCNSEIQKDKDGHCYKECFYECLESSSSNNSCKINSDCRGCGFKKFKVNCDGTLEPEVNADGNNLDEISEPNPLQNYSVSSPEANQQETPSDYTNANSISNNINHIPYFNQSDSNSSNNDNNSGCCGDIHYHYYMNDSNPSGNSLNDISRSGGIISNKLQDGIQQAEQYKESVQNSSDYNSAYNYGIPGSTFPTDSQGQIEQYTVNYKERPSVTGMFQETGPLGANIGMYGNHVKGCNCPYSGSSEGNNV